MWAGLTWTPSSSQLVLCPRDHNKPGEQSGGHFAPWANGKLLRQGRLLSLTCVSSCLLSLIILTCLGWDCVILGAIQRVKWFFFFCLKCVFHDLWTLTASWSLFYSLDKSTQEPEVLDFCLQSILQCGTLVGAVLTIGQIPKVKISVTQRSQCCSHSTGFHNHASKMLKV